MDNRKPLLKGTTEAQQRQEFDEIRAVTTSLRQFCQGVKKVNRAVQIIANQTNISKARVKEILTTYFKD